jgi:hypothetical protein
MGDAGESVMAPDFSLIEGNSMEKLITINRGAATGGKGGSHDGYDAIGGGGTTLVERRAQFGSNVATEGGIHFFKDKLAGLAKQRPPHDVCDTDSGLRGRKVPRVAVDGEYLTLEILAQIFKADYGV